MEKDRDQMTPAEPADRERIDHTRPQGSGSSGLDEIAGERSAPGGESSSEQDPAAVDELPKEERGNYR